MKKIFIIILAIFFLLFLKNNFSTFAQIIPITIKEQKQINPSANWNQSYTATSCSSKEDKCLIVWRDKRNDPGNENDGGDDSKYYGLHSNADIYGQFVKSDGVLIGNNITIATDQTTASKKLDQANPEVVYNPNQDEFFVTWHEVDPRATSYENGLFCQQGGYNLYAQRISASGSFSGSRITISEADDCQWKPRVAFDIIRNNYLIVWHDHRHRGTTQAKEIYGQFISATGSLLGTNFLVTRDLTNQNTGPAKYQEYPTVIFNPDKREFLVIFGDDRETPGNDQFLYDIWGQRLYYENGVQYVGVNYPIYKAEGRQEKPEITYDTLNKEYMLVFQRVMSDANQTPLGLRLNNEGQPIGSVFNIDNSSGYTPFPAVAYDEVSSLRLVAWENGKTYVRAFSKDGYPVGEKTEIGIAEWIRPPVVFNKIAKEFLVSYSGRIGGFSRLFYRFVKANNSGGSSNPTITQRQNPTQSPTQVPPTQGPTPFPRSPWTASSGGSGRYNNPGQGLFQCHATHKMNHADYIKGGAIIVKWGELQPSSPDSFDEVKLAQLISQIKSAGESNKKIYLHMMIYQADETTGLFPSWYKVPMIVYHAGEYKNPPPWNTDYQTALKKYLTLLNTEFEKNDVSKYIEYIESSAGGLWASTHLWISDDDLGKWAENAGCGRTDWACLGVKYNQGVDAVLKTYLDSFTNIPTMVVGGSCRYQSCNYNGLPRLISQYGMKLYFKEAGLGHAVDQSCGLREAEFGGLCSVGTGNNMIKCAQEPWGVNIECPGGVGFDKTKACGKNYDETYKFSLEKEHLSYYCMYNDDLTCGVNQATNKYVADHVGAQIALKNASLSAASASVDQSLTLNLSWENTGTVALIAPYKKTSGRWQPSSYKLFVEFVKDNKVKFYKELDLNPGTNTWGTTKLSFQTNNSASFTIPKYLGGNNVYKVYVGLTDPNFERKRFTLVNNEAANDIQNKRYLIADSFRVSGQNGSTDCDWQYNQDGDINNDGYIDTQDISKWKEDYTKSFCNLAGCYLGDVNRDGKVCLDDLETWRRNYQKP